MDIELIRAALSYDHETGVFRWRKRTTNRVKVGQVAGTPSTRGYVMIGIGCRMFPAHRLAWLYVYGAMPAGVIDHINGNTADNRIANLRDVPQCVNLQNVNAHSSRRRTRGLVGAYPCGNQWESKIRINCVTRRLGRFATEKEAHAAYIEAKRTHHSCYRTRYAT